LSVQERLDRLEQELEKFAAWELRE
jgi:hypothetical protein